MDQYAVNMGGSVWPHIDTVETEKAQSQKNAEKRAAYPPSAARFVRRTLGTPTNLLDNELQTHLDKILSTTVVYLREI